jgi:hypothetical protein
MTLAEALYTTTETDPCLCNQCVDDFEVDEEWYLQFLPDPETEKAKREYFSEMCERANAGELCIVCHWRQMDSEGGDGFGSGMCSHCADLALGMMGEQYA